MDRTTLARKLREALFDHIETGRKEALQDSAIDSLFEKVLASCEAPVFRASPDDYLTWTSTAFPTVGEVVLVNGETHTITGVWNT